LKYYTKQKAALMKSGFLFAFCIRLQQENDS
jgi:hypothetical protein